MREDIWSGILKELSIVSPKFSVTEIHQVSCHRNSPKFQMELAILGKTFIGAPGADCNCNCNICPYVALRDLQPRIEIAERLRLAAKKSLDRMLEMASGSVGLGDLGARS